MWTCSSRASFGCPTSAGEKRCQRQSWQSWKLRPAWSKLTCDMGGSSPSLAGAQSQTPLPPPLPDAHGEHTLRSLAVPLPRHAGEIQLTFYRWEDPENRVTRQLQDQAQDPTFLKRSAEYGNKIKFMSDNDLYELGKDDAPNWPLPPKAFQKGIVADRNPYPMFGLAEFD